MAARDTRGDAAEPDGVLLWNVVGSASRSKQEAARRAAHALERAHRVKTCTVWASTELGDKHMLWVMAPDQPFPPFRSITAMRRDELKVVLAEFRHVQRLSGAAS